MDDNTMTSFTGLSAVLTGFAESVIAPPSFDPIDIKSDYFQAWTQNVSRESGQSGLAAQILSRYSELKEQQPPLSDQQIGEAMLNDGNADFVMACRKLIYLWYMGAWPTVHEQPHNDETRGSTSFQILSDKAYTQGLVWKVMQSHPMGDSNYRYGYWKEKPKLLSEFTGNQDPWEK